MSIVCKFLEWLTDFGPELQRFLARHWGHATRQSTEEESVVEDVRLIQGSWRRCGTAVSCVALWLLCRRNQSVKSKVLATTFSLFQ